VIKFFIDQKMKSLMQFTHSRA